MYADDITLLSTYDTFLTNTDTDIATIQRNINEELLCVTTWLSRNKLHINTTKTKMTVFRTQQKHISYPDVIINNSHVEKKKNLTAHQRNLLDGYISANQRFFLHS